MSHVFRDLLRKIGSGPHTGQSLDRQEAAIATRLMLLQEATPAQIGAFMIAHRIKRPTGEELAGMLDAYDELGPTLAPILQDRPVTVLCCPYDGRDRTLPVTPITALLLATAGCPVLLHGGDRMPTKEGVPLVELWQGLGVDWRSLSLSTVREILERIGIGFVYLPTHFPLAQGLVPYREQIGKRPPFATIELMWNPYGGAAHVVSGFVHPPTEELIQSTFALRHTLHFTTVKGLEGSCDLPRERTAIIGIHASPDRGLERLHLHPRDYGFAAKNLPFEATPATVQVWQSVLNGEPGEALQTALWNGGFYLWHGGVCATMEEAIATAESLLCSGQVLSTLRRLQDAVNLSPLVHSL